MTFVYDHDDDLARLEQALGYVFEDRKLLERALTHRSFANEHDLEIDNQRLEFVGDAVLGLITAEKLFKEFRDVDEGYLSSWQASMVNESALYRTAGAIELGRYLRLGKGETLSGGREKPSLLADAYEAVLAAIYLDGGLEAARAVVLTLHEDAFAECEPSAPPEDHKSRLQRLIQSESASRPEYAIIGEHGPAHDRRFIAEVYVDGTSMGRGEGRSKKEAEQLAARAALRELSKPDRERGSGGHT